MVSSKGKKPSGEPLHQYKAGDIVLGKVSGFPFWPGMIVDTAPEAVLKQKRGSHNKIVRFIPDSNYGFCSFKELKPLKREDIEKYLNDKTKTKGDLMNAYKTALNPEDWKREADEAERAAQEALLEAAENEDELDDDADAPAAKKRKSSGGSASKAGAAKSKKQAADGSKKAETGKKRKADGSAAAAKDEDKEDGSELDPASKKVKGWRHELQRTFLGKDGVQKEALDKSADVFKTLEAYEEMTSKQLQDSKILKVLKKIMTLKDSDIPSEAEAKHNFKSRSEKLFNKWSEVLNGGSSAAPAQDSPAAAPAAAPAAEDGPTQDKPEPEAAPATEAAPQPAPAAEEKKEEEPKTNGSAAPAPAAAAEAEAPAS